MTRRATAVTLLRKAGRHEEADEIEREGKRGNKYGAQKTIYKGRRYDSKLEAEYAKNLDHLLALGAIRVILPQVPFTLPGGTVYRCDFLVQGAGGVLVAYDVKGHTTDVWRVKWREVKVAFPAIFFRAVRWVDDDWSESDD